MEVGVDYVQKIVIDGVLVMVRLVEFVGDPLYFGKECGLFQSNFCSIGNRLIFELGDSEVLGDLGITSNVGVPNVTRADRVITEKIGTRFPSKACTSYVMIDSHMTKRKRCKLANRKMGRGTKSGIGQVTAIVVLIESSKELMGLTEVVEEIQGAPTTNPFGTSLFKVGEASKLHLDVEGKLVTSPAFESWCLNKRGALNNGRLKKKATDQNGKSYLVVVNKIVELDSSISNSIDDSHVRKNVGHWEEPDYKVIKKGPTPFKFNNCWLKHKDFKEFVKSTCNGFSVNGWPAFVVKRSLKC
ncbi:unnamed protein product [Lupinus luteus]|uniref:Uncharacterized protein n=1 Tax=Lupinus luteus TaxID=3873 RepID=A0AAV1XEM2_LUPLU